MKIGIDLSPIQGPHRMRGIGYTLINLINNLPDSVRKKHSFIFFVLPASHALLEDPLTILDLRDMEYEVRYLKPPQKVHRKLPGRFSLLVSAANSLLQLRDLAFGNKQTSQLRDLDVFLQTDQSQSLPRQYKLRKVLVIYDIIPYVLEWDYLWSYKTARHIYGYSRKAALRCQVRRWLYKLKLQLNVRHADTLLAISEATKKDFVAALKVPASKIVTTPLGVNAPGLNTSKATFQAYHPTSWGYRPESYTVDSKVPFLLFVGGADKRRKLQDLVTAFNNLRAQGINLKLILSGDSMVGPEGIATEEIQGALKTSSYLEDIIFMGFTTDKQRDWLYRHALAYVFPSRYEGFGLPVLEAFAHDCPVISYHCEAVTEVAGNAPLYAKNSEDIKQQVIGLLNQSKTEEAAVRRRMQQQVKKYDWQETAKAVFAQL